MAIRGRVGARAALVLGALLAAGALAAQQLQAVPPLQSRVTDLTGTLTAEQQAVLEEKLAAIEARKGVQLAVLLVPTTQPEAIEQYSIRVVEQWKLGRGEVDDGVLLLVAKDDRSLRIEVGYGLEGALTDATSSRIIRETIVPLLRQGQYFNGINAGIDQITRVIDGEPLPPPDRQWRHGAPGGLSVLPFVLIGIFVFSSVLRALFGRGLGSLLTGAGAGFLVWTLSQLLSIAVLAGLLGFFLTLFGGLGTRRGWSTMPRHGGWGGGWGGLGGGRGGGFGRGGFGGLGGGFGGGGASGRW